MDNQETVFLWRLPSGKHEGQKFKFSKEHAERLFQKFPDNSGWEYYNNQDGVSNRTTSEGAANEKQHSDEINEAIKTSGRNQKKNKSSHGKGTK